MESIFDQNNNESIVYTTAENDTKFKVKILNDKRIGKESVNHSRISTNCQQNGSHNVKWDL